MSSRFCPHCCAQLFGKIDSDKRSLQFFVRTNGLYLRVSLPDGACGAGMQEVKAVTTGQSGSSGDNFYTAFKYLLTCDGVDYKPIVVNIKRPYSSAFKAAMIARLEGCCQ